MAYTLDDGQLLSLWTVISQLGLIREMPDPADQSVLLTRAQALLTAFVLDLGLLPQDPNSCTTNNLRSTDVKSA
jgi:hypothetical protein